MRVYIKPSTSGVKERLLIELQGDVIPPKDPAGQDAFYLYWTGPDKALCFIGYQTMEGKVETLEKPYLVVDRNSAEKRINEDGLEEKEVKVVMVIRKRMLFNTKPKPIVFKNDQ